MADQQQTAPLASTPAPTPNGKKILIVENDTFLLKVYAAKLAALGFDVRTAENGEEVEPILLSFTPDLILLGLVMPKKDGFEVLRDLKASPQWKDIPVIVASSLRQQEDKDRVMQLGAVAYITKGDISILEIIEQVRKYMGV